VVALKEEWSDWLVAQRQLDGAIFYFIATDFRVFAIKTVPATY
jgi:hypothetical protein